MSIYPIKRKITRKQIIAEIDRLVALLYGLNEEKFKNILHTFSKYYSEKEVEAFLKHQLPWDKLRACHMLLK